MEHGPPLPAGFSAIGANREGRGMGGWWRKERSLNQLLAGKIPETSPQLVAYPVAILLFGVFVSRVTWLFIQ
jgi:hypothetical protein